MTASNTDAIASVVVDRFRAGDGFGLLLTGDPHHAEITFRVLALSADVAVGHAESVDVEWLAARSPDARIVALAWDPADVHPALLRRCTAVIRFPDRYDGETPATRALESTRTLTPDTVVERCIRLLHATGLHDHGLDIATAHLARGLLEVSGIDPLEVIRHVVVAPRTTEGAPTSPEPTDGTDEVVDDDTVPAEQPDVDATPGGTGGADDGPDQDGDQEDEQQEASGDEPNDPGTDGTPGTDDDRTTGGTDDALGTDDGPPEPGTDASQAPDAAPDTESGGPQPPTTAIDHPPRHPNGDVDARVVVDAVADTTTGFAADGVMPAALPRPAEAPTDRARHRQPAVQHLRGRSGPSSESADRGRISRTTPYDGSRGIAVAPSLLRAGRRTAAERAAGALDPAWLVRDDLRSARRRRRAGVHTVIVVDGSSSLGPDGLLRAGSLTDQLVASAVARRGVVSVVVASGERSTAVSTRSTSLHRTRDALRRAPTGGGTPLADGLLTALDLLDEDDRARRRIVVVTDGRPTVDLAGNGCDEHTATAELEQVLGRVAERVPDVAMLPVGVPPGRRFERDTRAFRAVGARIL